jgi:dTDP-4-dehydrorhamnose reductase
MRLITGASGLAGANFMTQARANGLEAAGVYFSHPVHFKGLETVAADLRDPDQAEEVVRRMAPRWIIHCAGMTNVDGCEDEPENAFQVNSEAAGNIARAAARTGAGLVYFSTDALFDGEGAMYAEDEPLRPLNVYARSKAKGERTVLAATDKALVVRTNFYGHNIRDKADLAGWILGRLRMGEVVPGFTDVICSSMLVNDLCATVFEMIDQGLTGVYNVCCRDGMSKYDLAREVATTFDLDADLVRPSSLREANLLAPRPKNMTLDTAKVSAALGRPMPSIREGLLRYRDTPREGLFDPEDIHAAQTRTRCPAGEKDQRQLGA